MILADPVHPGEFIKQMYMIPNRISAIELANSLSVSSTALSKLLNKKSSLSSEMAIRLSIVLGRSAESWINLQTQYDLSKIKTINYDKFKYLKRIEFDKLIKSESPLVV